MDRRLYWTELDKYGQWIITNVVATNSYILHKIWIWKSMTGSRKYIIIVFQFIIGLIEIEYFNGDIASYTANCDRMFGILMFFVCFKLKFKTCSFSVILIMWSHGTLCYVHLMCVRVPCQWYQQTLNHSYICHCCFVTPEIGSNFKTWKSMVCR